ncbi:D-glycero-beta-D-manno-heptose 1-phosphate adenylyltransferase [Marinifilum caeruleilacunae]|uniref:D-glycero-beta-D-manno-heptose 1-phosphate adenylyltransferase n=1 Tax=Marinifilum caeruleilacunae TaxID=2499076 RepID=A0ABX1WY80_9BACT|nr:D-glycero-beta-D-manno-heptose 1-phosphate adenylyltransferase [Marinifilum caeruleilacunae]NOU60871.1 D-glycero-beta-D-manno-heptose 1-phosphate adenylyltransferase [Marinifilum caeruleilacunae]
MDKLQLIKNKIIFKKEDAYNLLQTWRFKEEKIVFSNGCFDIVHRGHLEYLASAASMGNKMIIGLNTDASTQRLKGPTRPINDEYSRALLLASLGFVDMVILFEEDTPYNLIDFVQPDILVKGSDYNAEDIVGYDIVKAKGGEIKTLDFIQGFSSTGIIKKIQREG